jgi:hypothetical protein
MTIDEQIARQEAAESKLATETARANAENREVLRLTVERNTAEAKLAAMLKLGENPSEEMSQAGYMVDSTVEGTGYEDIFKAMFAKLIEQAGVKK